MRNLKYSEILKANNEFKSLPHDNYDIAVLSNITVSQLKEILEYALRMNAINAYIKIGDYDNIVQDSKKFGNAKLVIIFWELANIIDGLQYKASLLSDYEIETLISKVKSEIDLVISNLKETPLVLINNFSTLVFNHLDLKQNNFDRICDELNGYLAREIPSNVILVNIDKLFAKISIERSTDLRYYYSSKALYSIEFYKEYSNFIKPIILSANGKAKKALIFDCDNTLWKGILGEDGVEGLEMSNETPNGVIFEEVQSIALALNKKGILIGLCSKNNSNDVDDVIKKHPHIKINEENITIKQINWDDKATNLELIARELKIGLDSMVFLDDSDFEVNLIREYLPQVVAMQVPVKLYDYPKLVREITALFYNVSEADEDGKKIKMYKEQTQRENIKKNFKNIEEYLRSLQLKMTVFIDDTSIISRMAQMTQKTNQFNLTTKRYTNIDIDHFVKSIDYKVIAFEAQDSLGEYGIVGLAIVRLFHDVLEAEIDSFLLSCRAIGRNLEFSFVDFIIKFLQDLGIKAVRAVYLKTLKNAQTCEFYESLGFNLIHCDEGKKIYKLDIFDYQYKNIDYIGVDYGRKD